MVHGLGHENDISGLLAEIVSQSIAGAMHDTVAHIFFRKNRRGLTDGVGQIEYHGSQARMPAAERDGEKSVRSANVEEVARIRRSGKALGDFGGGEPCEVAHAALV